MAYHLRRQKYAGSKVLSHLVTQISHCFEEEKQEKTKKYWNKKFLYFQLPEGKRVIVDGGLAGEPTKITIASKLLPKELQDYIKLAKARQETLHTGFKHYNILGHRFCHGQNTQEKLNCIKWQWRQILLLLSMILKMATPLLICHFESPYEGGWHGKKDKREEKCTLVTTAVKRRKV